MKMPKPHSIQELEKLLGVPLHPLRSGNVIDQQNRTCYELNSDGQISGLNLDSCRITDPSFLKELPRLTKLTLAHTGITDGSFLQVMNQLTDLDVYGTGITDWSFLQGMNQLTALDLGSIGIADGSFLKGMNQLTSLGLRITGITDGSFLKGMNQLITLNLDSSSITDWSFLKGMNQLTTLNLHHSRITDWSFLKELPQLTALGLGVTGITDGSFLRGMNQLTSLNLDSSRITDWSFLKNLPQLTALDLHRSGITDGSLLKGMNQLTALGLGITGITDGSFLKEMPQLTTLIFDSSGITDWSFLKELPQLTTLILDRSGITDGSLLKGMNKLTTLSLDNSRITDWSFLKELPELTALGLGGTCITDWSFLKELPELTTLDLSSNRIEWLPTELYDLDLEIRTDGHDALPYSINVHNNPLKEPPLEIVHQGHAAVMDWYHAAIEGEIDINEVKVVLVGDGSAGKTTVRKRLMGLPVDPKESQTHGIEIHDHEIECQGRKILAHFWDFGGQEIMHATHQFFLSRRSLYILLLDVRKEEDADYWLKHIESFGGDSPIVVCLNKIDQHPSFEVDRKNLQEKYRGIIDFYRLKCLEEGNAEVKRLIEELPKHIAKAEMSQSKWPRKWSKVKDRLQKDDKPFLEQSEFARICREEKIEEENRQQTLIRFLNDLGIALHFDDRRLKLLQILNPKWATQAVYRIINDPGVAEKRGVLELNRLSAILKRVKPEDFEYPQEKLEYIVDLMKKFEVCHELSGDRVLLPDLLGVQEPNFSFQKRDLLRFRLQYDYLPTSILPRIIVQMHSDTDGDLRWRTGVVLKRKDGRARAVIRSDRHERRISIEVEGVARRDYFAVIRDRFDKIHKDFLKFHVTEQVPLPDHPEVVVDYQDLLFHEEKKRKTILVGEVKSEYDVQDLLNGIEPKEKRQTRKRSPKGGDVNINIEKAYLGDDMSDTFNTEIGDNTSGTIIIGNHINNVIAEKIKNSFNKARDAEDRSNEIRVLLQSLAQEVAKIVVKLPPEKVEEAAEVADHLERITDESVKEKPKKSYWELSKKGIIEAAEAVGKVGETAIKLVSKLGTILGF